jgi:hypothetical protein
MADSHATAHHGADNPGVRSPRAGWDHPPPGEPAHLALFYGGDAEYVDGVMRFLDPGLRAGDPVAVVVPPARARLLARHLGEVGPDLQILDMHELGRNPARIIPAVLTMLEAHRDRTLHFVGEPVWPGRSGEEIREATRHEALINLAWPGASIRVLCPYDTEGLAPEVVHDAEITHPWLVRDGEIVPSSAFGHAGFPAGTDNPLPVPPGHALELRFGVHELGAVRAVVHSRATAAGLSEERVSDLVLAVNEVATNGIKHAGPVGHLRVWTTPEAVV